MGQLTLRLDENKKKIEEYEKKTKYFSECYDMEKALHYVEIPKEIPEDAAHIRSYLESDVKALDKDFDLALIGTKGKWYDHTVSVTNPVKVD